MRSTGELTYFSIGYHTEHKKIWVERRNLKRAMRRDNDVSPPHIHKRDIAATMHRCRRLLHANTIYTIYVYVVVESDLTSRKIAK